MKTALTIGARIEKAESDHEETTLSLEYDFDNDSANILVGYNEVCYVGVDELTTLLSDFLKFLKNGRNN